jgi:alanine racemase
LNALYAWTIFLEALMTQVLHVPTVSVHLDRICDNYTLLHAAAGAAGAEKLSPAPLPVGRGKTTMLSWPRMMPVIKADAYGHGQIPIAKRLLDIGAGMFCSGSVQEAAQLRLGIPEREFPILSLLGAITPNDVSTASELGVISVIHSFRQLEMAASNPHPLTIAIKCNTDMARLGFGAGDLPRLIQALRRLPHIRPVLVMTHLAEADSEEARQYIAEQARTFTAMQKKLKEAFPGIATSLANSAGTLLAGEVAGIIGPHVCRPGIALYGGNPFAGTSLAALGAGLRFAMWVGAPIIATRMLAPGEAIGYGHTFTAEKPTKVGIVAAGYADYYTRSLSNRGEMCVLDKRARILGRVSMQMSAIDITDIPDAQAGTEAWLMGGPYENAVSVQELADTWGTITYEPLCLLGNGAKVYVG